MIPVSIKAGLQQIEEVTQPSLTYGLRWEEDRVRGRVDGIEAVRQAVYKILNTERYDYLIYSWNYGIELDDLYGKPIPYIQAEIKRRIEEALTQDDRIERVGAFSFERNGRKLLCRFTVYSVFGEVQAEKEVAAWA